MSGAVVRLGRRLLVVMLAVAVSGCESLQYYSQAAAGQWQLWRQRQPLEQVLQDPATPPELKQRLHQVAAIRAFASQRLSLPDNQSYRFYADLERPHVVWNVVAAEAFSVTPKHWCFPIAGCVSYRGYFAERSAIRYADQLAAAGYDTYVAGVSAYSTLGWFADPVLNTFISQPETELAGLIFHELAHQQLYLPGDTAFNESFARAVELAGIKTWLLSRERAALAVTATDPQQQLQQYLRRQQQAADFTALLLAGRNRLDEVYQQPLTDEQKAAAKQRIFNDLKQQYQHSTARSEDVGHYERWLNDNARHRTLNNAKLAAVVSYSQWLPAFQQLLRQVQNDMAVFYQRAQALAALEKPQRDAALQQLLADSELQQHLLN